MQKKDAKRDVKLEANMGATGETKLDAKNGCSGSTYKSKHKTQCINLTQNWMQKEMQYLM